MNAPTQFGKYQLIRRIATGGMAEVYLAKATGPMGFEKTMVVKRILPHLSDDEVFIQMFLSEANLVAQLNHPNVVQIFDFGEVEGTYYIAMELIDGTSLRGLIKAVREMKKLLPFGVCARLVSLASEGLGYAHDFTHAETGESLDLVHRDISPDNILVGRNGAVKVVDFGIAKAAGQAHKTQTGQIKGKLWYMPPEQLKGQKLDRRTDIFALGVVLYELLTGSSPVEADSDVAAMHAIFTGAFVPLRQRRPDTPDALVKAVEKAMALDRDQRYATCQQFQADLERFIVQSGHPVPASALRTIVEKLNIASVVPQRTPSHPQLSAVTGRGELTPTVASPSRRPPAPLDEGGFEPTLVRSSSPGAPAPVPLDEGGFEPTLVRSSSPGVEATDAGPLPRPRSRRPLFAGLAGGGLLALIGLAYFLVPTGATPVDVPAPIPAAPVVQQPVPDPPEEPESPEVAVAVIPPAAPPEPPDERPRPVRPVVRRPTGNDSPSALARVQIVTTPPATVRVNGKSLGRSPVTAANLPPGAVTVELVDARIGLYKKQVLQLSAGDNGTQTLAARMVKLEFRVRPFAQVFVNGNQVGQTPFPPVDVYEGKHSIRLVNERLGKDVTVEHLVHPEDPQIFRFNLAD